MMMNIYIKIWGLNMSKEYESEAMLEEKLIKHLELLGYTRIKLNNLDDVKEYVVY